MSDSDLIPDDGAVMLNRIEIVEYLTNDGQLLTADRYTTADGETMPLAKKLGLMMAAQVAACIPMIQSAPDMTCDD